MAPAGEYDESMCAAAAVRAVATITITICCYLQRHLMFHFETETADVARPR